MLTKSQMHKENDDQVPEDVDPTRVKDGGMDNHDQTLNEGMISKNERNLLVCATSKEYRLITLGTLSVKNRHTLIKENFDVDIVVVVKSRNSMIFAAKYGIYMIVFSFLEPH